MLVTGKDTGNSEERMTAASENTIVVASAHSIDADIAFPPILSFLRDAVPDAKVTTRTGIAIHTPRLTMNDDNPLITESADELSPKISAVANPIRSAAIYVIHVFME